MPRTRRRAVLAAALLVLASSCAGPVAGTPHAAGPGSAAASSAERFYVSLGDSYAAGYDPSAGTTTTAGFAYQVAVRTGLRLVNFGCTGITVEQALENPLLCNTVAVGALGPDAPDYTGITQADAALDFLRRHPDRIALVTVVLGLDDLQPCLYAADYSFRLDAACVTRRTASVRANLTTLLTDIRTAVGPQVRIIGLTYPDVFLGQWVLGDHAGATASVGFFRDVFNPLLRDRYAAAGASFVDLTAAFGGYGPPTVTVVDPRYGAVPAPVARICASTYYCSRRDGHPTRAGYTAIADQVRDAAGL